MKYLIILVITLMLTACATNQAVNIPIPIEPQQIIVQPIGPLPISTINKTSTAGQVMTKTFQTIYLQRDYINYLLAVCNAKVGS